MKKLHFSITINAPKQKIWETMLDPETYKEWVNVSWPGSYYEGKWEHGGKLKFISPGKGGTLAKLVEHRPYDFSKAKHIAVITPDGKEDTESDVAKGWIGTTESYTFTEKNGMTELAVEINTTPAWEEMFTSGWPKALQKLKEIAEK